MKYLENCDLITHVPQHLQCGKFGDGGNGRGIGFVCAARNEMVLRRK